MLIMPKISHHCILCDMNRVHKLFPISGPLLWQKQKPIPSPSKMVKNFAAYHTPFCSLLFFFRQVYHHIPKKSRVVLLQSASNSDRRKKYSVLPK